MSSDLELIDPGEARDVLEDFVKIAERKVVKDPEQLHKIFVPEVGLALASLIILTGRTHQDLLLPDNAVAIQRVSPFTLVQGFVNGYNGSGEQEIICLEQYRQMFGFLQRRVQWSHVPINGFSESSIANDGVKTYMPYTSASDELTGFYRDSVGTRQISGVSTDVSTRAQTGLEIAGKVDRISFGALNGYLQTTARLISRLVDISPAR